MKGKAQQAMEKVEEQLKSVQESLQKEQELTEKLEKEAKQILAEREEMLKELEKSSTRGFEVQQRLETLNSAKVGNKKAIKIVEVICVSNFSLKTFFDSFS